MQGERECRNDEPHPTNHHIKEDEDASTDSLGRGGRLHVVAVLHA